MSRRRRHRPPGIIHAVDLEYGLREVEADGDDAGHGRSLQLVERLQPYSSLKEGVVHAIKWQLQHRYMQVEAMAELLAPANEAEARQIAAAA